MNYAQTSKSHPDWLLNLQTDRGKPMPHVTLCLSLVSFALFLLLSLSASLS